MKFEDNVGCLSFIWLPFYNCRKQNKTSAYCVTAMLSESFQADGFLDAAAGADDDDELRGSFMSSALHCA